MTKEVEARFSAIQTQLTNIQKENKSLQEKVYQLYNIKFSHEYKKFECANCGNPFYLNEGQMLRKNDKGMVFMCSAGHSNVFKNNI